MPCYLITSRPSSRGVSPSTMYEYKRRSEPSGNVVRRFLMPLLLVSEAPNLWNLEDASIYVACAVNFLYVFS